MANKVTVLNNGTVFGDLKIGDCFVYSYHGAEYTYVYMKIKPVTNSKGIVINSIVLNNGRFAFWSDETPVSLANIMIEARM